MPCRHATKQPQLTKPHGKRNAECEACESSALTIRHGKTTAHAAYQAKQQAKRSTAAAYYNSTDHAPTARQQHTLYV
eukprot:14219242-Heterocapsa_arctica.AAC.1